MSCGFTRSAAFSSSAAPANSLSTSTPSLEWLGGHVLLGDQVHPVAERGDEHDVGREAERHHLLLGVPVVQVADGRVADGPVVAVDPPDRELDLVAQLLVRLHPLAARARDLHERGVLDRDASLGEELAERLQAVADALRVVQPVDAQQDRLRVAEVGADLAGALLDGRVLGHLLVAARVDRDRVVLRDDLAGAELAHGLRRLGAGDGERDAAAHGHVDGGSAGRVPEEPADRAREVARVGHALEADDVRAEQPLDDLRAPRQLRVDAVGRERDVVEEADGEVRALLAQHLRHELQLVVLHPHRGAGRGGLRGRVGEALVHLHVGVPPLAVVARLRDDVVVQRPQRVVREALVVLGEVLLGEGDGDDRDAVVDEGLHVVVGDARPADPRALVGAHHGLERRDQSARRVPPGRGAVGGDDAVDGEAVGHDDEVVRAGLDVGAVVRGGRGRLGRGGRG